MKHQGYARFADLLLEAGDSAGLSTATPGSLDFGAAFLKMLLSFGAILFLLFATYWALKRFVRFRLQKGVGSPILHVVERKMLSPKTTLYVVEIEGKRVLFAESQLEVRLLQSVEKRADLSEETI